MQRIKKVKVTKENKISIAYEQLNKMGQWDEYSLTCAEKPRPGFNKALNALTVDVIEMCELPQSYLERIEVRGVSFSYGGEKEVMGATISARMKLNNSNTDLNINTPHKASDSYNDYPADEMQLLTDDCIESLSKLCDEVKAYINGDRAQMTLFGTGQEAVG